MSLKAKIEAVIYAAEEPVTLLQLVGLLGQEAQGELDAADARQGQLALLTAETSVVVQEVESGDQDALNAETLGVESFAAVMPVAGDEVFLEGAPAPEGGDAGVEGQDEEPAGEGDAEVAVGAAPAVGVERVEAEPGVQAEPRVEAAGAPEDSGEGSPAEGSAAEAFGGQEGVAGELSPAAQRARERRLREYMRTLLDELIAEYAEGDRGLEIREVAGGFRLATKPEYHDAVRGFVRLLKPPLKLSLQALETLAVVAYKQPVTAPEVSEIRGVDSGGVLGSLIGRKLVTTAGRKQVIGRPILYKTTKEFLLRFGLKDLSDLPSIEEFERLAADLTEAVQEEMPMAEPTEVPVGTVIDEGPLTTGEVEQDLEPNRGVHVPQADGDPNASSASLDEVDAENLSPAGDGPGEFTGNENVPPSDNVEVDGRESGVPPTYDVTPDEIADSPANDAAVQSAEGEGK